jgi:tetratricopeptide (TPR) repeat protein
MAHDVFISYAKEDERVADAICEALEKGGVRCWYAPRDVPYLVDYEEAIIDGISQSKLMLLVLSAHANNSAHVKREVQNACREEPQVPVLPFQIEDVPLSKSFRYYIGSVQWLVASNPPLEAHLQKLVNYVQARLPQLEQDEDSGRQRSQPVQAEIIEPETVKKDEEEAARLAEEALRLAEEAERQHAAELDLQASHEEKQSTRPALSAVTIASISDPVKPSHDSHTIADITEAASLGESKSRRMMLLVILASVVIAVIAFIWLQQGQSIARAELVATQGDIHFPNAKAEPYYREAVRLRPDNALYNKKLGQFLIFNQRYAEAERYYREAVRLNPLEEDYRFYLGYALYYQRKYAEAETQYREALRLSPNNKANYYYFLAKVLAEQQKYVEAELNYHQAIRLLPSMSTYHNDLGLALSAQQKYAEAEQFYREAIRLDPLDAEYYYNLGNALSSQQKYTEAKTQYLEAERRYREAVRIAPLVAKYQYGLGNVLSAQQKYVEAETFYREAVRLDPSDTTYQEKLKERMNR